MAVRNREWSQEKVEDSSLGSLAMQEEAHELRVLERVGRPSRAKKSVADLADAKVCVVYDSVLRS